MKKVLIITNIITLGLAIYFFSKISSDTDTTPEVKCCNYDDMQGETLDDFKGVIKRYKENSWTSINTSTSLSWTSADPAAPAFEDARCIWFSMDSIKQFICTIEKYSNQLNLTTDKLGIRFYYGQYKLSHANYPDRHTIFMMPTFSQNETDPAVDFDPRYNVLNGWGMTASDSVRSFVSGINSAPPASTTLFTILGGDPNMNPSIRNSGELCPPKCVPEGINNTFNLTDY